MSFPNYSDPLVANWSSGRDSITLTPSIFDAAMLGTYGPFEVVSNCTVGLYWETNFDSLCRVTLQFATLRLHGRPGRDGYQSALWDAFSTWRPKQSQNATNSPPEAVPQNSPRMHFDNHLDPVSRATSKWRIASAKSYSVPQTVSLIVLSFPVLVKKSDCVSVDRKIDIDFTPNKIKTTNLTKTLYFFLHSVRSCFPLAVTATFFQLVCLA